MSSEDLIPAEDRAPLRRAAAVSLVMRGCKCGPMLEIKLIRAPGLPLEDSVSAKARHHAPCPLWSPAQTREWFDADEPPASDEQYGITVNILSQQ